MIEVWRNDISLNMDWIEGKWIRVYGLHSKAVLDINVSGKDRTLTIHGDEKPFYWNGADGVIDLFSMAPKWHDYIVGNSLTGEHQHDGYWRWDDGDPITKRESSYVLKYMYRLEHRRHTGFRRGLATFLWWAFKEKKGKGSNDGN